MLWESLPDKFHPYNLSRHCVFADYLLIVSYVQGALRKELRIASSVERFKLVIVRRSC